MLIYYLNEEYYKIGDSMMRALNMNSLGSRDIFKAITIASGGLSGGISSTIAGGSFWAGARQGLITSGLNHVAYKIQGNATEYANDNGKKKGATNTNAKGDVLNWHDQEDSPGLYHYAENSDIKDGILEIHAHGNPNSIGGFKDVSKLGLTLYESSPSWKSFIDNGKGLTLELYSCRTGTPGGIAQKISSYYPELIVKAPTSRFTVNYKFNSNTGAVIRITNAYLEAPGKWVYYRNGQLYNP